MGCCQIEKKKQQESQRDNIYKIEEQKNQDTSLVKCSVQESFNEISGNFIENMKSLESQPSAKFYSQAENRNTPHSNAFKIDVRTRFLPNNQESIKDLQILKVLNSKQSGKVKSFETFDKENKRIQIVKSYEIESCTTLNNLILKYIQLKSQIFQIDIFVDFDIYAEQDEKTGKYFLNVLTEYQKIGNLRHCISTRKKHKRYVQEAVIFQNLQSLIQEMARFQQRGFFHGNIHPNNLFIGGSYQNIKIQIGDFPFYFHQNNNSLSQIIDQEIQQENISDNVSSVWNSEDDVKSLLYLSPQIQNQIIKYYYLEKNNQEKQEKQENQILKINHNPYKSDVYSLGLCFISLCTLQEISSLHTFLNVSCKLDQMRMIGYTEKLVQVFELMLKLDESSRPDFIQLQE